MNKPAPKDEAIQMALFAAKDFTHTVERVKSVIGLMDDAITAYIQNADDDDKVERWMPEVFTTNVRWLLDHVDHKIFYMRGALDKAGIAMEPMI